MFASLRFVVAAALVAVAGVHGLPQTTTVTSPVPTQNPSTIKACNNSPTLCSRKYNSISHIGAHNSAFLRDDSTNNSLAGNQFKNATFALDAGLRLLQAQVHLFEGGLRLCHTSCSLLDAGPLQTWLQAVNAWVEKNPNEVVTVLLVNSDSQPAATFDAAFQGAGLAKHGYVPAAAGPMSDWPTLQSMIDSGGRVVSFVTNMDSTVQYPYLIPEFNYVFETQFEVTDITGFNCSLHRPSNIGSATDALGKGYLSLVNHFKYQRIIGPILVPDVDALSVVNSAATSAVGNLGRHVETCQSEWSRAPNFVLVDFWNQEDPIAAVDKLNAVTDLQGRQTIATTPPRSGAGRRGGSLEHGALLAFMAVALLLI